MYMCDPNIVAAPCTRSGAHFLCTGPGLAKLQSVPNTANMLIKCMKGKPALEWHWILLWLQCAIAETQLVGYRTCDMASPKQPTATQAGGHFPHVGVHIRESTDQYRTGVTHALLDANFAPALVHPSTAPTPYGNHTQRTEPASHWFVQTLPKRSIGTCHDRTGASP